MVSACALRPRHLVPAAHAARLLAPLRDPRRVFPKRPCTGVASLRYSLEALPCLSRPPAAAGGQRQWQRQQQWPRRRSAAAAFVAAAAAAIGTATAAAARRQCAARVSASLPPGRVNFVRECASGCALGICAFDLAGKLTVNIWYYTLYRELEPRQLPVCVRLCRVRPTCRDSAACGLFGRVSPTDHELSLRPWLLRQSQTYHAFLKVTSLSSSTYTYTTCNVQCRTRERDPLHIHSRAHIA
jgi:hypothetical protein